MSKLAAVIIDDWQLPIFKQHLDAAGYRYNDPVPFMANTLVLQIHYEWAHKLKSLIETALRESRDARHEIKI